VPNPRRSRHRFDSRHPLHVRLSVGAGSSARTERRTSNPRVAGSNPARRASVCARSTTSWYCERVGRYPTVRVKRPTGGASPNPPALRLVAHRLERERSLHEWDQRTRCATRHSGSRPRRLDASGSRACVQSAGMHDRPVHLQRQRNVLVPRGTIEGARAGAADPLPPAREGSPMSRRGGQQLGPSLTSLERSSDVRDDMARLALGCRDVETFTRVTARLRRRP
jgi:hypothetical protein